MLNIRQKLGFQLKSAIKFELNVGITRSHVSTLKSIHTHVCLYVCVNVLVCFNHTDCCRFWMCCFSTNGIVIISGIARLLLRLLAFSCLSMSLLLLLCACYSGVNVLNMCIWYWNSLFSICYKVRIKQISILKKFCMWGGHTEALRTQRIFINDLSMWIACFQRKSDTTHL